MPCSQQDLQPEHRAQKLAGIEFVRCRASPPRLFTLHVDDACRGAGFRAAFIAALG